ncbi:hypothetical protein RRG08_017774 [Elysia crispata]|uniref:Uncharacterized protein n=1 Tax=Elysia crispata TaxID=231223 RepID=A0AAE0YX44_9GAST|nr:hypothetical protein RRG08_017774 [Elysia crispata]
MEDKDSSPCLAVDQQVPPPADVLSIPAVDTASYMDTPSTSTLPLVVALRCISGSDPCHESRPTSGFIHV